jgi:carbon storage regulator CsrA
MLVLTRKATEEIQIGASIKVTVLATSGNRVKLGISCPAGISIRRAELPARKSAAAGSSLVVWQGAPAAACLLANPR